MKNSKPEIYSFRFKETLLGYWYCSKCKKYHSPRVKAWRYGPRGMFPLSRPKHCSLWQNKKEAEKA